MTDPSVSRDTATWVDGVRSRQLPLPDRGLEFGDGLFETLLVRGAEPLFTDFHLRRLLRGCRLLAFPDCADAVRENLRLVSAETAAMGWHWSALRLTLTRGAGPRGYAPPEHPRPRIIIGVTRLDDTRPGLASPAVLGLANLRWSDQPALAGLKHLNRLEQVLAARECREAGTDEAVMLDQAGAVVSVVAGNLFVVHDGTLLTAPLDKCGIAGTRRALVMQRWAPALGLAVREEPISIGQLETADEVFFSNSLVGLRPVARFGPATWTSHAICEALYRQYQDELG